MQAGSGGSRRDRGEIIVLSVGAYRWHLFYWNHNRKKVCNLLNGIKICNKERIMESYNFIMLESLRTEVSYIKRVVILPFFEHS